MSDLGRHLDLSSDDAAGDSTPASAARPFLGVHFTCCDVYSRVYPNPQHTAYVGHCPRCARRVEFLIGPGGTDCRFFRAE
jgi:hypothetical protein